MRQNSGRLTWISAAGVPDPKVWRRLPSTTVRLPTRIWPRRAQALPRHRLMARGLMPALLRPDADGRAHRPV
jgi:hypothetical protein